MKSVVIASTLIALVPLPAVAAGAAATTCGGRPATIVAAPRTETVGTPGADVIVAPDTKGVDAGDDDVVCASSRRGLQRIDLGPGSDRLETSVGAFRIDTGDREEVTLGRAPSYDVVVTSGDSDAERVETGARGFENRDDIALGGGLDSLTLRGEPRGRFTSGSAAEPGVGRLHLRADGRHAWAIDVGAGTASVDGIPVVISGFTYVDVRGTAWSSLAFTGSDDLDFLRATKVRDNGPVTAATGGAQDIVRLDAVATGSIDGGTGRDILFLIGARGGGRPSTRVDVDLGRSWAADGSARGRLADLEELHVRLAAHARVDGTARGNEFFLDVCGARVRGRGGNDGVEVSRLGRCGSAPGRAVAFGGTGDDELFGTTGGDRLVGGPGFDTAFGQGGSDRCATERRYDCER